MWINPKTQQIFKTHSDIRQAYRQVSFPHQMPQEAIAHVGLLPVIRAAKPPIDHTKNVTEGTPVLQDGKWMQVWNITDATAEEIEQRTEQQADSVRAERNAKLSSSDWTQVADAPVDKQVWADYRQALRNVPDQAGFPWSVEWPEQP
jgi:hypothetical protein